MRHAETAHWIILAWGSRFRSMSALRRFLILLGMLLAPGRALGGYRLDWPHLYPRTMHFAPRRPRSHEKLLCRRGHTYHGACLAGHQPGQQHDFHLLQTLIISHMYVYLYRCVHISVTTDDEEPARPAQCRYQIFTAILAEAPHAHSSAFQA